MSDYIINFFNFLGAGLISLIRLLSGPDKNYIDATEKSTELNTSIAALHANTTFSQDERRTEVTKLDLEIKCLKATVSEIGSCDDKIKLLIKIKSLEAQLKDPAAAEITQQDIKKVIFTSAGGSAHENATFDAIARRSDLLDREILIVNVTTQGFIKTGDTFVGRIFAFVLYLGLKLLGVIGPENKGNGLHNIDYGAWGVDNWNLSQKIGDLDELRRLIRDQSKVDLFFGNYFERQVEAILQACPNIEEVESNQPLCTQRIVRQVQNINATRGLSGAAAIKAKTILTLTDYIHAGFKDEEVGGSSHFNIGLANIDSWNDVELRIPEHLVYDDLGNIVTNPTESQKIEQLFKIFPKLKAAVESKSCTIVFTQGPIRQPFKKEEVLKSRTDAIKIKAVKKKGHDGKEIDEITDLQAIFGPGFVRKEGAYHDLTLQAEAKVHTIMLGSQVSEDGTISLVNARIKACQMAGDLNENIIFVFCGSNTNLYNTLKKQSDEIRLQSEGNIKIVPLGFQDAELVAHVFGVSDSVTFRSSGGMCLELESILGKLQKQQPDKKVHLYSYTEMSFSDKAEKDKISLREKFLRMRDDQMVKNLVGWERSDGVTFKHRIRMNKINATMSVINSLTAEDRIMATEYSGNVSLALLFTKYFHNPTAKNRHALRNCLQAKEIGQINSDLFSGLQFNVDELSEDYQSRERFKRLIRELVDSPKLDGDKANAISELVYSIRQKQRDDLNRAKFVSNDDRKIEALVRLVDSAYRDFLTYNNSPLFGLDLFRIYTLRASTANLINALKAELRSSLSYEEAQGHLLTFLADEKRGYGLNSISYHLAKNIADKLDKKESKEFLDKSAFSSSARSREISKLNSLKLSVAVEAVLATEPRRPALRRIASF